jgi:hypothetical protein
MKNEPVNFLLVNALRMLSNEQRAALTEALYERTPTNLYAVENAKLWKALEEKWMETIK